LARRKTALTPATSPEAPALTSSAPRAADSTPQSRAVRSVADADEYRRPIAFSANVATDVELSIVLPCLNEAETIETCVRKARGSLERLGVRGEVVVADNGSADGSQELARRAGARVVPVPRPGYGAALRGGIEAAHGRYVLMADADDSYALDDIGAFVDALRAGTGLVMGNRFAGGIEPRAMPLLHRYVGNPLLSWAGRRFFGVPIHDFHSGIRAFDRETIRSLGLTSEGMEFASEMVVRATLAGVSITEVPTRLRPDGRSRPPHLRTWQDGWRHLRFLLMLSPRWLLLYPALVFLAVGTLGVLWLSAGIVRVGPLGLGVHTMLACATFVVVGLQLGGLALVARTHAARTGLLPPSPRLQRWLTRLTVERGLLVGSFSLLLGVAAFVVAFVQWGSTGFGQLDVIHTLRWPVLGMVLIVGGIQLSVIAFVIGVSGGVPEDTDDRTDSPAPALR
jgi:hypothetical protein